MVVGLDFLVWWVCDRGLVVESGGVGGGVGLGLGRFMIGMEVNLDDKEGMVCRLQPPFSVGMPYLEPAKKGWPDPCLYRHFRPSTLLGLDTLVRM